MCPFKRSSGCAVGKQRSMSQEPKSAASFCLISDVSSLFPHRLHLMYLLGQSLPQACDAAGCKDCHSLTASALSRTVRAFNEEGSRSIGFLEGVHLEFASRL